jgi:hypothetical protein
MKMKKPGNIFRRGLSSLAVLLFLFPPIAAYDSASSQNSEDPPESYKRYAKLEPISNRRITFQLRFQDGQVASATQLEGALIRVESTKDDTIMGLSPLISDDGKVQLKIFRVDPIRHRGSVIGEGLSEIDTLALYGEEARISNGVFSFGITLAGTDTWNTAEKKTL